MKLFIIVLIVLTGSSKVYAQDTREKNSVKGKFIISLGSTLNNSRYLEGNQDNGLYKELTVDYGVGRFVSVGVHVGHQERTYNFLSAPSEGSIATYNYTQTFIPTGLRLSFHLTPFVIENLNVKVNPDKFDFYLTYLAGAAFNSVENQFSENSSPDNVIDYSNYRTNEDISYQAGLLTGVRFKPTKNFGVFLEGGMGSMGNVNFGISLVL